MKKVLILANSDAGLFSFRKELIEEILKENEVYISSPKGQFAQYFIDQGCQFIDTEISRHGTNPFKDIKLYFFYKKTIKRIKPDIVLTYTIKPNVYGGMACAKLKVPYVANITGLGTAVENPGILQKVTLFLYRKGLRKAQKVFFQNEENMNFMLDKKVVKGAYGLLPGSGVNLTKFTATEYPKDDVVNFLFVARVMKEKGIDQYLDSAKYITEKYPNTRFHICGGYEQDYKEEIEALNNEGTIIYHGQEKDMKPIYQMASCTVHPTYYPEGMSNVLLESCASGRPIITTNRSGCREVVDDGINGYIVNQKDSKDLIEKIEKFLSLSVREREEMGQKGRAKVEKEFDRKIVIDKYLEEINNKSE